MNEDRGTGRTFRGIQALVDSNYVHLIFVCHNHQVLRYAADMAYREIVPDWDRFEEGAFRSPEGRTLRFMSSSGSDPRRVKGTRAFISFDHAFYDRRNITDRKFHEWVEVSDVQNSVADRR